MTDVQSLVTSLETLLKEEETAQPIHQLSDLNTSITRRSQIAHTYEVLSSHVRELRRRMNALPRLAPLGVVHWAQAVQAFPNLVYLEVDTDGLQSDADILRLVLLDHRGETLYDQLVKPKHHPISAQITTITGITSQNLEHAPALTEIWAEFSKIITGKYVLSFNLEFDTGKLEECATRYQLTPLTLIGDCLMLQAGKHYDSEARYLKLASLCARIGFPLPEQPVQTALDRAQGQMRLLAAMAQGITDVAAPDDGLGDLDEHPF